MSFATPLQAFDQAVQRPDIVRMLGALHRAAQAQIVAIDLLGLRRMALVEQQCGQRMARRMHPGPRLGVGEVVVELDRAAQVIVSLVVPAW